MPLRLNIPPRLRLGASSLGVCLFVLFLGTAKLQATGMREIRFWSLGEVTRVVVQFDGDFSYKWNRLEDPPRAFFDLPNVELALVSHVRDRGRVRVIEVNDPILRQIRYAENSPGTARVVLDLNESCSISTSLLANPARLVIELRSRRAASPEVQISRSGVVDAATSSDAGETAAPLTATSPIPPVPAQTANVAAEPPAAAAVAAATAVEVRTPVPLPIAEVPSTASAAEISPSAMEASALGGKVVAPDAPLAKPARRTANGQQSLVRALGLKIGKVVIDPGHGGKDHGTTGVHGLREKDLVLDVAQRLAHLVRDKLGSEVTLTRDDDLFVSLEERTAIANRQKADLFLSVHANSSPYKLASGSETFFLNFTASREAMDVAARENASSQRSVAELQDIVRKITLKDKRDESEDFAARIQTSLHKTQRTAGVARKNRGVKSAPFIVLVGAEMPSVLVEIGFLSNAAEEAALKTGEYRQKIAEALLRGLETYMDSLSHFEGKERASLKD